MTHLQNEAERGLTREKTTFLLAFLRVDWLNWAFRLKRGLTILLDWIDSKAVTLLNERLCGGFAVWPRGPQRARCGKQMEGRALWATTKRRASALPLKLVEESKEKRFLGGER